VPDTARRELKARTAARGQSLNAYLLDLIDREVSRPTVAEVLQRASGSAAEAVDVAREQRDEQLARHRG
jgi:hypothetical protein